LFIKKIGKTTNNHKNDGKDILTQVAVLTVKTGLKRWKIGD